MSWDGHFGEGECPHGEHCMACCLKCMPPNPEDWKEYP